MADLGLDIKPSQGLGFVEMVRYSGYPSAGAMFDRGSSDNDIEKDEDLPVCVSERAYFAKPAWIKTGFDLLQFHVRYKRD